MKNDKYIRKILKVRIIDGDTIEAVVDLGFYMSIREIFRLRGIDTPEIRTRDKKEKKKGLLARQRLEELFCVHGFLTEISSKGQTWITPVDGYTIETSKGKGKYGRWLATIYSPVRVNINERLIKEGHAVESDF